LIGDVGGEPLPPDFCARPAEDVARDLLGRVLVSSVGGDVAAGRIVEAEAYVGPHDDASHAASRTGRTARNAAMFGPPGTAYVYRIYGIHWCLNIVTDRPGYPAAVLVRALEPLAGWDVMRRRRGGVADRDLARGPGRLAQALGVDRSLDGHALRAPPLLLTAGAPVPAARVAVDRRVGVVRAADWPLRFFVEGSRWISRGRQPGGTDPAL
jgi:DNA-3-methyladenine glycosylase